MTEHIVQVGKRGTIVVPAKIRKRLGITDGSLLVLTEKEGGFHVRPAKLELSPVDRKVKMAQRLLTGAENLGEYLAAIEEVRRIGLDPDEVPHERYSGR